MVKHFGIIESEEEPDKVVIFWSDYENLIQSHRFLRALEAVGVDNWIGWEDAIALNNDPDFK